MPIALGLYLFHSNILQVGAIVEWSEFLNWTFKKSYLNINLIYQVMVGTNILRESFKKYTITL